MDYRVKVMNVPSVTDRVKRKNRAMVNGLRFGWSDKLEAVVSEPASEGQVRSFRRARGYAIIDAVSGEIISEPGPVEVNDPPEGADAPAAPQPREEVRRDPNIAWLEDMLARYHAASDSSRERFNKDELTRALRTMKVNIGPEASKADMRAMLEEVMYDFYTPPAEGDGKQASEGSQASA